MSSERTVDDIELLDKAGEWGLLRDLKGYRVCLTGKMSMTREQLARLVWAAGGQFTNTMSGSVNLLVTPAPGPGQLEYSSTKASKARREGVRTVTELDFVRGLLPTPDELLSGQRASWKA